MQDKLLRTCSFYDLSCKNMFSIGAFLILQNEISKDFESCAGAKMWIVDIEQRLKGYPHRSILFAFRQKFPHFKYTAQKG